METPTLPGIVSRHRAGAAYAGPVDCARADNRSCECGCLLRCGTSDTYELPRSVGGACAGLFAGQSGATIIDSLDTLYIMNMTDVQWLRHQFFFAPFPPACFCHRAASCFWQLCSLACTELVRFGATELGRQGHCFLVLPCLACGGAGRWRYWREEYTAHRARRQKGGGGGCPRSRGNLLFSDVRSGST